MQYRQDWQDAADNMTRSPIAHLEDWEGEPS